MFTTVLLTEKALTAHDVERFAHLHDPEPIHVHVVVPAHDDRSELAEVVDDLARADFAEALHDDHDGESTPAGLATSAQREVEILRWRPCGPPASPRSTARCRPTTRSTRSWLWSGAWMPTR